MLTNLKMEHSNVEEDSVLQAIDEFESMAESSVMKTIEDFEIIAENVSQTYHIKNENSNEPATVAVSESKVQHKRKSKSTKCSKCDKVFNDTSNLKKHVFTIHDKLKFECNLCNKKFTYQYLIVHKKVAHIGIEKVPCNQCDNLFSSKHALKRHVATIHKIFTCSICNQEFDRKLFLNTHMKFNHAS